MHKSEQITPSIALRSLPILSHLDDDAINTLAVIGKVHSYGPGTILFHEGDQHHSIYFVRSGTVRLDMLTTHCGRQTILSVGSGELLAWSSLVGNHIMTASAIAVEETQVIAFHASDLLDLFEIRTDLGYEIMRVIAQSLSRRLLATRLQLLDLYQR